MYFLYSVITAVGMVLLLPYFLYRGLRDGKYISSLRERLCRLPPELSQGPPGAIWLHAVSVGEAMAALPLARRLKQRFPRRRLVISTTTATGQRLARERMDFADAVFYFPLDWTGPVRSAFAAVRPALIVILETEIWPNFLRIAQRESVPVLFVNGRLSERSFRRYQRLLSVFGFLLRGFLQRVLASPAAFLMQSEADARRVRELGAPSEKVAVAGNMKYDFPAAAASPFVGWLKAESVRRRRSPVIVAGSVTAGEESLVLIAFGIVQGEWPRALLVIAPRKPERFDAAAVLIEESHRKLIRRSRFRLDASPDSQLDDSVSVVLLDTIGELAGLYGVADGVFVGGSLVPSGGHNILEPAGFGKPPLFGPSMENFRAMAAEFLAAGAALRVNSPEDLGVAWIELIRNSERARKMGVAARELVDRNRGATEQVLDRIAALLPAEELGP